jgi:hypothetical protein
LDPAANSAHAAAIANITRRGSGLDLSLGGTIWVIVPSRIEHQLLPAKAQRPVTQAPPVLEFEMGFKILFRKFKCEYGD